MCAPSWRWPPGSLPQLPFVSCVWVTPGVEWFPHFSVVSLQSISIHSQCSHPREKYKCHHSATSPAPHSTFDVGPGEDLVDLEGGMNFCKKLREVRGRTCLGASLRHSCPASCHVQSQVKDHWPSKHRAMHSKEVRGDGGGVGEDLGVGIYHGWVRLASQSSCCL